MGKKLKQAMNSLPITKKEKRKDKNLFGKKTYTADDFLKEGYISGFPIQLPKEDNSKNNSDWAESSDGVHCVSGSKKEKEPKVSKDEVAVSNDVKKPEVTATPKVASQEVAAKEEEVTGSGDTCESAPSPALECPSAQEAENEMEVTVGNEVAETLSRLLLEKSTNRQIMAWIEKNLDKRQRECAQFVRVLVTSVCQAVISAPSDSVYHVNAQDLMQRSEVLRKYARERQKQLEALNALENLLEQKKHPYKVLHRLFDILYDEMIIEEDTFHEWKGAAEQSGRDLALQSVTDFFEWLSK